MAQLVKMVQGLAIASVKTTQGLAIASVKTILGVDNTSGGGLAAFSYDFTGSDGAEWDSAKFTEFQGSVNILSNTGRFVTGSFGLCGSNYTGGSCTTVSQYQRLEFTTAPALSFLHMVFRYTNSSSPFYTVECDTSAAVTWYRWADLAAFIAGTSTTVAGPSSFGVGSIGAGDTIAVTMDDTGTNTVARFWHNTAGAGPLADTPTSASVWGGVGPDVTWTADPASPVDTGLIIGVGCFQSTADSQRIDNWFGGDTPP